MARPSLRATQIDLTGVAVEQPTESAPAVVLPSERPDLVVVAEAVEEDATAGTSANRPHLGAVAVRHQESVGGQDAHQPAVGRQQILGPRVEIGVVVLDAGEDRRLRPVVKELRAAIEVGGVVLVPLDDEALTGADGETALEIPGHSADEKAGPLIAVVVDPGGHRGRRRLAVGAGDDERLPVGEEEAGQRLRHRQDLEPALASRGRLGIVATDGVADDDEIRRRLEVVRAVADLWGYAGLLEQGAHRRVERPVRASHAVPLLAQETGERRHPAAADRDQVNVERRRHEGPILGERAWE
jgi:hypothetical protein